MAPCAWTQAGAVIHLFTLVLVCAMTLACAIGLIVTITGRLIKLL